VGTKLTVTPGDVAWMAGVLDLKGKFIRTAATRKRTGVQHSIRVRSTDYGLVHELARLTGTTAQQTHAFGQEFSRHPCRAHCPEDHVHVYMDRSLDFAVSGVAAAVVAHGVAPYMRLQQEHAVALGNSVRAVAVLSGRGSGATAKALARLENAGWELPAWIRAERGDDDAGAVA
jgi:hypothetical protein